MSTITKEGVTVKVGQVWKDLDKRVLPRQLEVLSVNADTGHCTVSVIGAQPYRTTRIKIARMHKTATGYALVSEPSA